MVTTNVTCMKISRVYNVLLLQLVTLYLSIKYGFLWIITSYRSTRLISLTLRLTQNTKRNRHDTISWDWLTRIFKRRIRQVERQCANNRNCHCRTQRSERIRSFAVLVRVDKRGVTLAVRYANKYSQTSRCWSLKSDITVAATKRYSKGKQLCCSHGWFCMVPFFLCTTDSCLQRSK